MRIECVFRGLDDFRVVGETEVVVGAEVQYLAAVGGLDRRRLRRRDHAFGLVQTLLADRVEFVREAFAGGVGHGVDPCLAVELPSFRRKSILIFVLIFKWTPACAGMTSYRCAFCLPLCEDAIAARPSRFNDCSRDSTTGAHMPRLVKCGLIQTSIACGAEESI